MIVYIFIIIVFLIGIYTYDLQGSKKNKLELYYTICLYLTLLSGLSYRLGGDGASYEDWFSEIPTFDKLTQTDFIELSVQPLFLITGALSKSFINDVWFFHTIQSGLVCFIMFWFIRKYTKYIFTASFLFFICLYTYFCFEVWKESLAVSMCLISYYFLNRGNWIKYYIYGFIAFLFHFSGILFLLFPILKKLRFNKIFFVILIAFWFLSEIIVKSSGVLMYSELLMTKYDRYLEVADNLNAMWYLMSYGKNVLAPIALGLWFKFLFKKYPFEWCYCTYVILGIGTLQFAVIFERPTNYILPFIVVSMAQLIGITRKLRKGHVMTILLSFMFSISCRGPFFLSHEGWRVIIPYESIFTKEKNNERERVRNIIHVG